ncbi:MAG: P2 family phage major capsid protein [Candidatus Thiothrix singaporensis]|uniref:P2 family phage major capsid protein n=1 Tax=Candidatus Thiothrix singaporensis TaxID=2799669 RepID=A0A7L6ARE3_9GAMM|nr:MAG: P2 family phage major capsid protein [Candidatus Thiothrix singaporensis]
METSNAGYAAAGATIHDMGQDFHEGWLQYIIRHAPEKVWGMNADGSVDPIKVSPGGDFKNMDALVFDARHSLLPRAYRKSPDMGGHAWR